jgi:ABC-2 type transport system permease protein
VSWREQIGRSLVVAKKDVWIYYLKGPVIVFGLIFPLFLLIAFTIGRNISLKELFPGVMGMAIFFTSTAVGPAILPWEARSRTLERLVCSPVSVWALLLGDVLASFFFGLLISLVPLIVMLGLGVEVVHLLVFGTGMILATFCFASLSILLSVYPPTDVPATVMMLSSLVRFPLVFISGVFLPVEELPSWGRAISSISPLTYFIDLARYSITGISYYSIPLDLAVLLLFAMAFLLVSIKLHERFLPQRLS